MLHRQAAVQHILKEFLQRRQGFEIFACLPRIPVSKMLMQAMFRNTSALKQDSSMCALFYFLLLIPLPPLTRSGKDFLLEE